MRKRTGWVVLLIILFSVNLIGGSVQAAIPEAAVGNDIIISSYGVKKTGYSGSNPVIYKNDSFTLTLMLENKSEIELKDVFITIEGGTFFPKSTGSRIFVKESIPSKGTEPVVVELIYSGAPGGQLPITISYTKLVGETTQNIDVTDYVGINVMPGEETPPQEVDTTKFMPKLGVVNTSMPVGKAGQTVKIPLSIKNNSLYQAKDVVVTPELNESLPFIIDNISLSQSISSILPNATEGIELQFKIPQNTPEKIYPLKLNYEYYNPFGDSGKSSEIIYIKVENPNALPRLLIRKIELNPQTVQPGGKVSVNLYVMNMGNFPVKDAVITLKGLTTEGFTLASDTNNRYISKLDGRQETIVKYELSASQRIQGGQHGFSIEMQYKDELNNDYSDISQFFIPVQIGDDKRANMVIESIQSPKGGIDTGGTFDVSFNLKNIGKGIARNIKISLVGDQVIVPTSPSIKIINSLSENQTERLEFKFLVASEAETKNYPIAINVEYEEDIGGERIKQTINQYVGVYVEGDDEGIKMTPKIIVDRYSSDPAIVRAGENFSLKVSFLNTNKIKAVQNIKIFLTVSEGTNESGSVFSPVNSSNTLYIDYIGPKQSVERELFFYTIPDAQPKTYTITANFEYEDEEGNQYNPTELIGIPVIQEARLETSELNLPSEVYMGQSLPIFLEIYNMGKVKLNNLMVKVEGDFQVQGSNYFIGNFEPGNSDYFETMIMPNSPGRLTGNILFTYDNTAGEQMEIRKEFSVNVMEMSEEVYGPDFPGDLPYPEPGRNEGEKNIFKKIIMNKFVWIGGSIVLGIVIGLIIWRIIKKKGMTFDE